MLAAGERLGLIAGGGVFPLHWATAARDSGHPVTALAIEGSASPEIEDVADEVFWLGVGQVDTLISLCQEREIRHLAMAGKIEHSRALEPGKLEPRALRLLLGMRDRRAESILLALIRELDGENIEVIDSSLFLKSFIPEIGLLTPGRPLTAREQRDVAFGMPLARELARLDIGMTLVVKEGIVIALEGIDGTDETIRRGGRLAGRGAVAVKSGRPRQDFRFDLPIIGLQTIEAMAEAGVSALAFTAGDTLFFDQAEAVELAERSDIGIIAPAGANSAVPT